MRQLGAGGGGWGRTEGIDIFEVGGSEGRRPGVWPVEAGGRGENQHSLLGVVH